MDTVEISIYRYKPSVEKNDAGRFVPSAAKYSETWEYLDEVIWDETYDTWDEAMADAVDTVQQFAESDRRSSMSPMEGGDAEAEASCIREWQDAAGEWHSVE
jgi:hypothetical protein